MKKDIMTKGNKKMAKMKIIHKPIQGHYGLEFALKHIDKDLTDVFKILDGSYPGKKVNTIKR